MDYLSKQAGSTSGGKRPERSELLMPAGNLEKLKMAVLYGADAIYMGTPDMSLRTKSQMTLEDVVEGIEFAHAHGKRVYLTLNLFSHNKDIDKLPQYVETVRKVKPDGLIVADPGVFMFVKSQAPELEASCVDTGQRLFLAVCPVLGKSGGKPCCDGARGVLSGIG